MSLSITRSQAKAGDWVGTAIVAFLIAVGSLALLRRAGWAGPELAAIIPAVGSVCAFAAAMTGWLLFSQFRNDRVPAIGLLAAGYFFSAIIAVAYLLASPGLFSAVGLIGGEEGAVLLWALWHTVFPVFVLAYALGGATISFRRLRPVSWAVGLGGPVIAGAVVAAALMLPGAMEIEVGTIMSGPIGIVVWLMNAGAFAAVLFRTRCRMQGDLGLALALFAELLGVTLALFGSGRFTYGWYGVWLNSLISAGVVLFCYVREAASLQERVGELQVKLDRLSGADALTGLLNRRHLDGALGTAWRRSLRDGSAMSVLWLDVDFFRAFNDLYGRDAGDACLRRIAESIAATAQRPDDVAARFDGEEFVVILPATDEDGAHLVAEALRYRIWSLRIPHEGKLADPVVTASIGIASVFPRQGGSPAMLLGEAREALRAAKAQGHGSIMSARPANSDPTAPAAAGADAEPMLGAAVAAA